ncbi:MAG: twin-arginine translocation pathway signal [Planctomycetota bacterium]|nr:MAG: twin-arginine translocation pathway signal [Planctomycetota bacterium]
MTRPSRRTALKSLSLAAAGLSTSSAPAGLPQAAENACTWGRTHDRIWLGASYWANPMEDWRIVDGGAECTTHGGGRNVHLITHQCVRPAMGFSMQVTVQRVGVAQVDGGAGFRLGVRSELNEYRSNAFASGGIPAGIRNGELVLGRKTAASKLDPAQPLTLNVEAQPGDRGGAVQLVLTVTDQAGAVETLATKVPAEELLGNVAIVNNFDAKLGKQQGARYRFTEWTAQGEAFQVDPQRAFGPILWAMYSLSDSRGPEGFVMKITALTGPLGERDNHQVELQVDADGEWQSLGVAELDSDAWTATFRVPNWDATRATPYRLVYHERHRDGSSTETEFTGTIHENPQGRPLRLAALTCQKDYAFPYQPVCDNLLRLQPDMLYFSGDQLYEDHGGFGLIREPAGPAILNYLRKYYMFGWAFREPMRHAPTLCIPDDHDVFQGNIWGEGGAPMKDLDQGTSSKGGYREPARMVNVVHKTNCSHHPDFYDPRPVKQGISVYYGDMVYGDVSFAVVADRQFKSGPERVNTGGGRADHVPDPDFDTTQLDKPGLVLLGERQEEFLRAWAKDWRGHTIKVLLSQTVFAGVATHHGSYDGYLKADLDSGGWPQTARNNAIRILRESMALHINGDQHLTSLVQYGVERQRDSNWSFCTPAIAAGYPRWWRPDELGMPHQNRPRHALPNTGEYLDGLGNKVYVYAVGNPEVGRAKNRYDRAHEKGSGFGMVTIDPVARTYTIESFRFLVDATDGNPANQFPGWPVVIHQEENKGSNRLG